MHSFRSYMSCSASPISSRGNSIKFMGMNVQSGRGKLFLLSRREKCLFLSMRHFFAAQKQIDIVKYCDLLSLQAVICMIVFLQSAGRISTCHPYIGIAVTIATKLGLHRKAPGNIYSLVERETWKRTFWTIQRLDAYTAAIRGCCISNMLTKKCLWR